jgi:hypothetical protein
MSHVMFALPLRLPLAASRRSFVVLENFDLAASDNTKKFCPVARIVVPVLSGNSIRQAPPSDRTEARQQQETGTRGLQRFIVLFFIELSTRKVEIAGIAPIANGLWIEPAPGATRPMCDLKLRSLLLQTCESAAAQGIFFQQARHDLLWIPKRRRFQSLDRFR